MGISSYGIMAFVALDFAVLQKVVNKLLKLCGFCFAHASIIASFNFWKKYKLLESNSFVSFPRRRESSILRYGFQIRPGMTNGRLRFVSYTFF